MGGKVIFLRPRDKDYELYYAHPDSQMVMAGQEVRVGDTIGLAVYKDYYYVRNGKGSGWMAR